MDNLCILLEKAPEVEVADGLVFIVIEGRRTFAYRPHTARLANERVRHALDQMDADNAGKVVAFR